MKRDGGGGGGVQRIDAALHGDAHAEVGGVEPALRQPLALAADREREPGVRGPAHVPDVHGVLGRRERQQLEAGLVQQIRSLEPGIRVHGTANTAPIEVRTARR